ncbi:MAG: 5-(carboxyamino)imidazole ribonucleotide mutase [Desulfurococcus sp.]|jgi:5-(carboxyamino)imidazole ribonucleotide mutase|uniref:5-(carboxyamino)imidazole ribonucleotide mutase n=1 Tax=Desulfurococcus sp. TaxID=51678 RepID=UPI00316737A7
MPCKGKVAVIVGSERDLPHVEKALNILRENNVDVDVRVLSAHRTPKQLEEYIEKADVDVYIAMAGLAAHLPGFIASRTSKPVIGVPLNVALGGLDALLSIVQMPKGIPVATVGIDNAENAAYLALRIINLCRDG